MKTAGELKKELKVLIEQEGNYEKGYYRDILYEVKRMKGSGHWCGYIYIELKKGITLAELTDNEINYDQIKVHGGITFESVTEDHIIYGFDCAHGGCDIMPSILEHLKDEEMVWWGTYRTKEYTINQCKSFIDQVIQLQKI